MVFFLSGEYIKNSNGASFLVSGVNCAGKVGFAHCQKQFL